MYCMFVNWGCDFFGWGLRVYGYKWGGIWIIIIGDMCRIS